MKSLNTLLVVLLAAGSMVACNKNDAGSVAPTRASAASFGNPGGAVGSVTNGYDMTEQVRGFLDTDEFDTQSIKSASSSTGVMFKGVVRFDDYQQLIPDESYITFRVTYLDQNNIQQIVDLGVRGAQGQVQKGSSYGQAKIIFEDVYGSVTMEGNYDSNNFMGDMSYTNKITNAQGKLGQFRIQTCGFFKCVQ